MSMSNKNLEAVVTAVVKHVRDSAFFMADGKSTIPSKTSMPHSAAYTCAPRKLRVGTWNVESMSGRPSEVVETVTG